jgi:hypothetical protein
MPIDTTAHAANAAARILVVSDWTVDPHAVIALCRTRAAQRAVSFALVVPAWLHGLDWVGDPAASAPCAQSQLQRLAELGARAGLDVDTATVGDPDVMSAIGDALNEHDVSAILLFERFRRARRPHPFDLGHRARRATGRPVERYALPPAAGPRGRLGRVLSHGGRHCHAEALPAA